MRIKCALILIFISAFIVEAQADFSFQGQMDFPKKSLEFTVDIPQPPRPENVQNQIAEDKGSVQIKAQQKPNGEFHVFLDVGHLRMPQFYFSGNIEGVFKILEQENSSGSLVFGSWKGDKPSINFETVERFAGEFKVADQILYLQSFTLGDVRGQGKMELNHPYKMDFDVQLNAISMSDFLSFWMKDKEEAQGDVSGKIKISGGIDQLALQGKLESYKGFVRQLKFDSIYLDVAGIYPQLNINQQSTISKSDGLIYSFEGSVNLDDKDKFKNQLKKLKVSPLVAATQFSNEWTIKRSDDGNASTSLKYLLRQNDDIQTAADSDMLGVERLFKF